MRLRAPEPSLRITRSHHRTERGVVAVPDKRLDALAEMYSPELYTPAVIELRRIAGAGARRIQSAKRLGNKFLSHIRDVDAVIHVLRCFDDDDIIHVEGRRRSRKRSRNHKYGAYTL